MPIYEFVCQKCHKKTEVIQSHSDKHPTTCPHCGGRLKKAFSAPAIQFKGSGWYVTDYGKGDSGPAKPGGDSGESSSEKKGEAKPEKKDSAGSSKSESAGSAGSSSAGAGEGSASSKKTETSKKESKKRSD
ncbi:MAG: FmdB family zinc ribbon protein [Acidobacteriota bacterium]